MENLENTSNLIPILTVFISGLFGLIVAIVTWNLANHRENRKFKQEIALRAYKEQEDLYISILSSLDRIVKYTHRGKGYEDLYNDLTLISAKAQLLATEKINEKFSQISEILSVWTSEYQQSLPHRIGETSIGIISSLDNKHREKADKLFPLLTKSINDLVTEIKIELKTLMTTINK